MCGSFKAIRHIPSASECRPQSQGLAAANSCGGVDRTECPDGSSCRILGPSSLCPEPWQVSKEAAQVATDAKGSWHNGIAEEWLSWVPIVTGLREFAESLDAGGRRAPHAVSARPDGQLVADVMPLGCDCLAVPACP